MVKTKIAALLALGMMASCVGAENSAEANIRKNIEPRLGGAKIQSIRQTPYSGLYELRVGGDILYADKKGQYLFIGHVYDAKSSQNLTRTRMEQLSKVKFSDLPLDLALKQVKGDGKRTIAVFEDPNCGYCKRLRQTTLKELDNVTIYTFMYNILNEDSIAKSRNIWCAPDKMQAWDDWMIDNKLPPAAAEDCKAPHEQVLELGQKLNIQGTPAIFFTDGTRIPGAVDLPALEAKLKSIKK
ncbi:DsbC family protein [Massilia sp. Dwa41.01b]|uniref:DsbC family protein n=1 Tax=unclassified Massilia TaxID=2609279 RepID=UPI001600B111|nr:MULTISPECIES: DsbC family protein [unclassified Massilia]QNA90950.1 DsbC family protein [Massilia sp. Dwa41.01b]QNB01334.1 DsbC family protein [Massilia sp. Se16.2.3]